MYNHIRIMAIVLSIVFIPLTVFVSISAAKTSDSNAVLQIEDTATLRAMNAISDKLGELEKRNSEISSRLDRAGNNSLGQLIEKVLIGLISALIAVPVTLFVAKRNRRQQYYHEWVNQILSHNWKALENEAPSGLPAVGFDNKVLIMCYQHVNLLFLAWLNKDIINKDRSIDGLRNWVGEIKKGAEQDDRFARAYHYIFTSGDLYPADFLKWLDNEMLISAERFKQSMP